MKHAFHGNLAASVRSRLRLSAAAWAALGACLLAVPGAPRAQQGDEPAPLRITRITPSGTDVSESRQIVFQFDRQVVPLGRMDREPVEIPIEITPALDCRWRWIDTSALACQLGDGDAVAPATRYAIVVAPGIVALDGSTLAAPRRHEFVTERPRVLYAGFATWRGPATPVMRVSFSQPVTAASVREHLYLTTAAERRAIVVERDPDDPGLDGAAPRGDGAAADDADRETSAGDDSATATTDDAAPGDEARRFWLVSPAGPLPADTRARLEVEPGLVPATGTETGDETRAVVEFDTFPEFRLVGVTCTTNANERILIAPGAASAPRACNPLGAVGLTFTAPVVSSEVRDHVAISPDLAAAGRDDYDPWASSPDFSQLYQPHRKGRTYIVWLPARLEAARVYAMDAGIEGGPKDEFGRSLAAPIDLEFPTDHRPPDYTLAHSTAVLESEVDSDVPLYVTNLDEVTLGYRKLTRSGRETGLTASLAVRDVDDVAFGLPLGVRALLGGESGAVYGELATAPALAKSAWNRRLFAQVTPYQVHVKLGHFNTLVWVLDLATGEPVADARIALYTDRIADLSPSVAPIAEAATDADGAALLAGSERLDPALDLLGYGCAAHADECPRLFVRVDGARGLALLPLDNRFEADVFRASGYSFWSQPAAAFGHLDAWGTTAQGVYRAGDTLEFKLYVRNQDNETYVAAPRRPYRLEIVDPTGRTAHTVDDVALSEFGAFSGDWAIPETAAVGWYQFKLTAGFGARPTGPSAGADETRPAGGTEIVRFPMRVLVSDFTPASFGVTTRLTGDLFGAGDEVAVETRAELHSGGPYLDAEARISTRIETQPFTSAHPVAASFSFDSADARRNAGRAVTLTQLTGRVGEQGELRETFSLPDDGVIVHGRLIVEGAVRDDRGRYVASTAAASFVAVDRFVGLRSTRWVHEQGEPAEVEYLVVDARGVPAGGTDVHVDIERLETKAARVKGAGNAYLTRYVEEWVPAGACDGRSAESPGTCTFVPDASGSYRLTATIADTEGRTHRTTLRTWVAGRGRVVWSGANDDALEIVPEQAGYAIGDTARYLIKNPYPGARALVTIERYGVLKQWVETLEGSTPIIDFEIENDFMPGFYLSVLAMSPRVAAPPTGVGELDLGKPAFKLGYVAVPVDDPVKRIDVTVTTDAGTYRPGDTVRATIAAAPRVRERREPIEVAVIVLDEAVLDLVQRGSAYFDPYAGFYALEPLDVRNFSLLTRLVGRQKIELKGANPGGDGGATLAMRSEFDYVSYFNPSLVLDENGRGEIEFEVPDNLTGWRVLVLATTPTDRMGLGMHAFDVNLPTEIRAVLPNQVTEGDRFTAAFSVTNRTDEPRDIRVAIRAEGDVATPVVREATVRLEPYRRTTVAAPVEAGRLAASRDGAAGRIRFTVTAEDRVDGDGLAQVLPVRKRRALETASRHGSIDLGAPSENGAPGAGEHPAGAARTVVEPLRFPADIDADVGSVGVVLSPSVLGSLDGAFRHARDYAYASWEQHLTRAAIASRYRALAAYLPEDFEWPGSASLPSAVLARAADYQAPNGGMAYFVPQDEYASPYLSAYTALAFAWLAADGHTIPQAVETRLHAYLDAFLRRDVAPDFYTRGMAATVRAVALAALAERGHLGVSDLERYRGHVDRMSLFGKAQYLRAALSVDGAERLADDVLDVLLQDANRAAGALAFNESLDRGYARLHATPLRANCAILSALVAADVDAADVDAADAGAADLALALARSVTRARGSRDRWRSSQENVFCVGALADYARRYETAEPAIAVDAAVETAAGRAELGSASFSALRDAAITLERPIGASDAGTDGELTLDAHGSGRLYYAARITYSPAAAPVRGVDAGVDVRKEYSVRRDDTWVLLGDDATVARGELVRVDLFVSLPAARNFLVVDDPVPGGLEPVNRDLATASLVDAAAGEIEAAVGSHRFERDAWRAYGESRWSFHHRELRHDAVRFYSDYLPPGNYHLSYAAQAIAAGVFAKPAVRAEEMYDPDVYGRGTPGTLTVEEP